MLQSMELQRVGHDLVIEQQLGKVCMYYSTQAVIANTIN